MAIVNGYTALATLKGALRITGSDASDDARLERIITSASRAIEEHTGRRFYAETLTRYLTPARTCRLLVSDLLSVTTLKTDEDGDRTYEITWSSARDYYPWPPEAVNDDQPYTAIEVDAGNGLYQFPRGIQRSVQIVGSWGYSTATPALIEEACLRHCARLYALANAPLGVAGTVETGLIRISLDRDLIEMLAPYRLIRGFA